jgi:tetratricopeptide (TPR) repeat protein
VMGYHCIHRTGVGCEMCEASLPSILGLMMMVDWKFWRRGQIDHKAKARKAYNKKLYDEAEPHLRTHLTTDEDDVWALDVLARLLMNTGRNEEAIRLWERYSAAGGEPDRANFHIAKCLRAIGDLLASLKVLESLILQNHHAEEIWEELQRTISATDDAALLEDLCARLEDAKVAVPAFEMLRLRLDILRDDTVAVTKRITGILTGAESDTEYSGASFILSPKWRLRIADILIAGDLPAHALMVIKPLDSEDPRRTKIEITAHRLLGDHDLARDIVESTPDAQSETHGVQLSAIRLAWDIGDMEGVMKYCDALLSTRPDESIASRFRLHALVKMDDIPRLRSTIDTVLLEDPANVQALRIAIDIAFSEDNDWEKTIELCDSVLEELSDDRRSLCHRAISQARMGDQQKALATIEIARAEHPMDHEVDLAAAEIAREIGDGRGQLDIINGIFTRQGYSPISSTDEGHRLNIGYLSCGSVQTVDDGPLVSIIMTIYGKDELLDVAIDSILKQTHPRLELIVVDDCSPDDAFYHVSARAESEPQMMVLRTPVNGGTYLAKNIGLQYAKGDFIGFMDSDDWTHPERIAQQLQRLIADKSLMGTCDSHFKIDDESHIPYRGKGASRMTCISLLMRREVLDRNGFFDALRVGADTEYIERITASFGAQAFLHVDMPTILVTQQGTSLTGGGRFHISWRSITGDRLGYHSALRAWHRKIVHQGESPFVPYPLRVRPFPAPAEMLAGDVQWRDGDEVFSTLIGDRNSRWWTGKADVWQKHISDKMIGRNYANLAGAPVPKLLWSGKDMNQLPELHQLPSRVVIKPSAGWSANNVFCFVNGVNMLDDEEYDKRKIIEKLKEDEFLSNRTPVFMVEEMLLPEVGRESDGLPRDYKFYCYGEQIALVHVVLRKSSIDQHANIHHYLDCDLKPICHKVMSSRPVPDEPFPLPDCWDEMLEDVRTLGRSLGCFMRIDMFATDKGPVFGEFTPTPEGGKGYTEWADKYLATFWKGLEGDDEGSITEPPEWVVEGGLM